MQIIEEAINDQRNIEILYLKGQDEKSRRLIRPLRVGEMEYKGYPYLGLDAFCLSRQENRRFNVDRILEIGISE